MNELIEAIRVSIATGATTEQKAIGAQACRTILAALDATPGKPISLPGTPPSSPLAGASLDQVLDMVIARLSVIARDREERPELASSPPPVSSAEPVPSRILRLAPSSALQAAPRAANTARAVPPKKP